MKKIAIYGGSFDPPHKGHRLLAENLAEKCGAEKVIIIPASLSPFKEASSAGSEHRLQMCSLNFDDELFEISDIEIKRGDKSYTVDTLREIKKQYPDSDLYLFMGDDMLLSFDKWYCYKEILSLARLVCACRTNDEAVLSRMREFARDVLELDEAGIIFCEARPIEISSTEIRKGDTQLKKEYLDSRVFEYIMSRGLYNEN